MTTALLVKSLPAGYRTRFASIEDLPRVAELYNICEMHDSGVSDYSDDEVRAEWEEIQIDRDVPLILTGNDQIVGALQIESYAGGSYVASGYVHPLHTRRGLGAALVRWSEERVLADPAEQVSTRKLIHATNDFNLTAGGLFSAHGFSLQKKFVRMRIDLEKLPEDPDLPGTFHFESVGPDPDLEGVYSVIEESFRDHWSIAPRTFENWREMALGPGYNPDQWSQIFHGDRRVGVAIGQTDFGEGWIRWVGVREDFRRLGLGRALMLDQFQRYWRTGVRRIGLGYDQTNLSDPGRLYERVGMTAVMVTALYEKSLTVQGTG